MNHCFAADTRSADLSYNLSAYIYFLLSHYPSTNETIDLRSRRAESRGEGRRKNVESKKVRPYYLYYDYRDDYANRSGASLFSSRSETMYNTTETGGETGRVEKLLIE